MKGSHLINKLVSLALEEDLAFGDVTSSLTIPEEHRSRAVVVARERLVMCGAEVVQSIVQGGHWKFSCEIEPAEGDWVEAESVLVRMEGSTRELLAAERTILNFLQRLCGVATYTRTFCAVEPGLVVLDTRKTLPGWRVLDKYAVRVGGGKNHRFCLGDMILVKNNHIDANPLGIRGALASVAANKPLHMPWEVEVRDLAELAVALEFKPSAIMLDNFSDEQIAEAMKVVRAEVEAPLIEVSGGITQERLARIRAAGADAVSVGSLTTKAPHVDISMRIAAP